MTKRIPFDMLLAAETNERNNMSRTKRALPEDIDVTDPREPALPDDNEDNLSLTIGWALWDIAKAISTLERNKVGLTGDLPELDKDIARLRKLVREVRKPF